MSPQRLLTPAIDTATKPQDEANMDSFKEMVLSKVPFSKIMGVINKLVPEASTGRHADYKKHASTSIGTQTEPSPKRRRISEPDRDEGSLVDDVSVESKGEEATVDQAGPDDGASSLGDAIDEQEIRWRNYVQFDGDEPDDYVDGPERLVLASDGVRSGPALLLTYSFSQQIKDICAKRRALLEAEQAAAIGLRRIHDLQRRLKRQTRDARAALDRYSHKEESQYDDETAQKLQKELLVYQEMQMYFERTEHGIERSLKTRIEDLQRSTRTVTDVLDEAFVHAVLAPPRDLPLTDEEFVEKHPNLQESFEDEYKEMRKGLEDEGVISTTSTAHIRQDTIPSGDTNQHYAVREHTPEEQAKLAASQALFDAGNDLRRAEYEFDSRQNHELLEREENHNKALDGYKSMPQEKLDAHWFVRNQELTRKLIEAENTYEQAKIDAIAAGISNEVSDYMSDDGDEPEINPVVTQADIEFYPTGKIELWLDRITEEADPEAARSLGLDKVDLDEVNISDSISCVADIPYERKKIDEWRRRCANL